MLKEEYTIYSNNTIVFQLHHQKILVLGQNSVGLEKVGATSVVLKNRLCRQEGTTSEMRMAKYKCTIKHYWLTTQAAVSFTLP